MKKGGYRFWSRNLRLCLRTNRVTLTRLQDHARAWGTTESAAAHYLLAAILEQCSCRDYECAWVYLRGLLNDTERSFADRDVDTATMIDVPF